MEQKTVDMILISIQNLQKDQKAMGTKFVKLTEAFKNTISKMEKKNNEKFGMYEKRMNKIEEPLEGLKVVVHKHSEDVSKLEDEYRYTVDLINLIDNNLTEMESKIKASEEIIEKIKHDDIEIMNKKIDESEKRIFDQNTGHWESETKQCVFDRKGYCNKEGSCIYFHSE